ncbi:hypothetical protein HMPREF1042_1051 [Streptococcus constellatus subsp. pharyngis SK1060 = CCUG 46377]|uniref:Uncharacterized protein n=1 Tax=Streptococcus constellatus subsp. pharyngis SK1060 = CCUG 46377 TaxID=1035184 RepID=F9P6F3_STRCV|nr:hypothetical protein HMPREF1042_1051 [Streptococcus constellatus subsp. pharyngis SK1060 = CCUG 46377]
MKQENTNRKEKMIIVEKSTKWWMTVVASGSLAVGLLGGLGIGSLATNALNQQTKVQTSTTAQTQKTNKETKVAREYLRVDKVKITKVIPMEDLPNKTVTKMIIVIVKMDQEIIITQRKKLHQMLTVRLNQTRIIVRQKIMTQIQQILNILEKVML